jgi:hypothetical protein
MELKARIIYCSYGTILASKQLKNTFSKQGALKTNLKVENFDYPSVNVMQRLMELILN